MKIGEKIFQRMKIILKLYTKEEIKGLAGWVLSLTLIMKTY